MTTKEIIKKTRLIKYIRGPFLIIEMPVDELGNGPSKNPKYILWEVWDSNLSTCAVFELKKEAELFKEKLDYLTKEKDNIKNPKLC